MIHQFRLQAGELLSAWDSGSPPTREAYLRAAETLSRWRTDRRCPGLWHHSPLMLTATIDDGWGHGLDVIERIAEAAGVRVRRIGLLRTASEILDECRKQEPDLLGLTVLQFDSDDTVDAIVRGLPARTLLVAGGAAYRYDPDFAARTGTRRVARDGSGFLRFLLEYRREK